ncbi:hypothetical protein L7F22_029071 [Adiantum nelumboides]|nr:hypothetical protein [Adiantum nelumboides]
MEDEPLGSIFEWEAHQVSSFIKDLLGIDCYTQSICKNEINGRCLLYMSIASWESVGVDINGHQLALHSWPPSKLAEKAPPLPKACNNTIPLQEMSKRNSIMECSKDTYGVQLEVNNSSLMDKNKQIEETVDVGSSSPLSAKFCTNVDNSIQETKKCTWNMFDLTKCPDDQSMSIIKDFVNNLQESTKEAIALQLMGEHNVDLMYKRLDDFLKELQAKTPKEFHFKKSCEVMESLNVLVFWALQHSKVKLPKDNGLDIGQDEVKLL